MYDKLNLKPFFILMSLLLVVSLVVTACGGAQPAAQQDEPAKSEQPKVEEPTKASEPAQTSAEEPTTAPAQSGGSSSGQLTIAGSSALLPLIQEAANEFQKMHPEVQITVTAGGSGAGRSQVCGGQVDIGNSDVPLSADEKTKLDCPDAVETAVAIQAFAPVANKQGPGSVTSLTKEQLVGIFTGQITNWQEVGGDDQEIVLINRAKGSGTRANMAKFLFGGDDSQFAVGASEEDNNETVLQTVSQTPGAVSYLGFAYLSNPEIIAFGIDGVAPTKENIQAGRWPIGGPGYSITKQQPTELEQAFLDYVIGSEFQNSAVFDKLGFVSVGQ